MKTYQCYIAGERPPCLTNSKACYIRFMEALLKTESKLVGSYVANPGQKSWWIASVDILEGKEKEFEQIAKCTLVRHPDICIGRDVQRSVKYYTEEPNAKP